MNLFAVSPSVDERIETTRAVAMVRKQRQVPSQIARRAFKANLPRNRILAGTDCALKRRLFRNYSQT
jgi:hypothetical protein